MVQLVCAPGEMLHPLDSILHLASKQAVSFAFSLPNYVSLALCSIFAWTVRQLDLCFFTSAFRFCVSQLKGL